MSEQEYLQEMVTWLRGEGVVDYAQLAMVLGSGWGSVVHKITIHKQIPYGAIPHWFSVGVSGHAGTLLLGEVGGVSVLVCSGRVHLYEGYSGREVVRLVRALGMTGAGQLLITNAAGGIRRDLSPGDLMLLTDHVNLTGDNPLWGSNLDQLGTRFPDMSEAYDKGLRNLAIRAADLAGIKITTGIYAAFSGPSYETPAEIRMLGRLGVDAIGMSTVPEVIAARHMGMKVLGISCITNHAAGISPTPLSHQEVTNTAHAIEDQVERFFDRFIYLYDER